MYTENQLMQSSAAWHTGRADTVHHHNHH